jgi:hypothetical protein
MGGREGGREGGRGREEREGGGRGFIDEGAIGQPR